MAYEDFGGPMRQENKANQSQFQDCGWDVGWIPASAGMTDMEFARDGGILTPSCKTKPICERPK